MKALEIFWLIISMALLVVALYVTWLDVPYKILYYVFPAIGLLMYFKRRRQRKQTDN